MARPTQREIVDTYRGNLGYFRKRHYLRRLRLWLFILSIFMAGGVVAYFHWSKNETIYSTGPLSENHARFATDCAACHLDAKKAPSLPPGAHPVIGQVSTSLMDRACLQCHILQRLHLPQATSLALQQRRSELIVAHAQDCSFCHKEHAGPVRMPVPESSTCLTCHADTAALAESRKILPLGRPSRPQETRAENVRLADGLVHFIVPPSTAGQVAVFRATDSGHPAFGYEQPGMQDPARIRYNHKRHEKSDIPPIDGRRMNCADCHQPGPGGAHFQPIKYEQHCAKCHSLQIQPSLPRLTIPHGDSEKVRYFLAGLGVSFEYALRAEGLTDPVEIARRVDQEKQSLQNRGLYNLNDLEQRVFFKGDAEGAADRRPRSGARKFLTECIKCHEAGPGSPTRAPRVERPLIANRWLQKGRFTHEPHQHMNCADCHGAVSESSLTTDILLPTQRSCAECHRPPAAGREVDLTGLMSPPHIGGSSALTQTQREAGGVRWGCVSCHTYHSPADTQPILQSILHPPAGHPSP